MTVLFATLTLLLACLGFTFWRSRTAWRGKKQVAGVAYTPMTNKQGLCAVTVGAPTRASVEFELKPESRLDRFAKGLGLSVEGQVGEPDFDRRLYLDCDDPYLLTGMRYDHDLPEALLDLFSIRLPNVRGVSRLVCRGGTVRLVLQASGDLGDATRIAADVAPALLAVAARLDASAGTPRRDPLWMRAAVLLGIASGLFANGLVQSFRVGWNGLPNTLDDGSLALYGAIGGATLLGLLLVATWSLLGRTSRAHLVLLQVLAFGGPGAFATALTLARDLNMDADTAPATDYATQVVGTRTTHSRKGDTHRYVTLGAWPGSGGNQEIEVSYDHFPPSGTPVTVRMHDGFLGMPWIESFEPRR
jgi:hypothetical protein